MTLGVPDGLTAEIVAVLRGAGARFGLLHGSRVAGSPQVDSDVDVAAWWPFAAPPAFEVLLPPGVDLVVLNGAPLSWPAGSPWMAASCSTTTPRRGSAGPPPCARSTPTSSRDCGAATTSSPRPSDVVDEVRVLRLLRSISDDLAVLLTVGGHTVWSASLLCVRSRARWKSLTAGTVAGGCVWW
ncbi:MAG: nucleotidyltransferase domain-containing protein [Pseudonocardiaceae bacterium]